MRVSEVTLTHKGNKESVNFTEDANLEVIDRRKCFFLKGTIQNICVIICPFQGKIQTVCLAALL